MTRPSRRSLEPVVRRSALLIAMYGTAAVIALWISRDLGDLDYGWHLRTGEWTVAHWSVPDAELFSANAVEPRWVAYSWAYDVLLCGLQAAFGIWAPLVLSVAMSLLIAHALFTLVRRTSGRTAIAAGLTVIGIVAMAPMLYGRSTMFSILFAALEVHLLLRATVLEDRKALVLVPLVFVAWVNVHVQYLYGFFLYACFLGQAWVDALRSSGDSLAATRARSLATRMTWIGAACVLATLVNPYHVRIYDPLLRYLQQAPVIYQRIQELGPQRFTTIPGQMTLAVALVGMGAVRRNLARPFLLLMFAVALCVGFRSARDSWFLVVTGAALIALAFRRAPEEDLNARPWGVAAGTAGVVAAAALAMGISADTLRASLRRNFPVEAAEFIESRDLKGPMYNHYNWGGYLMWRLPRLKVSIDGRSYVHSTEYIEHSIGVWETESGWKEDPELAAAGFVVGSQRSPLITSLKGDPRFHLAYEDEVSAVFVRTGQ